MLRDCDTCGGTGRVLYHGESEWSDCPACDGTGCEDYEPDDIGAVREPDPGEADMTKRRDPDTPAVFEDRCREIKSAGKPLKWTPQIRTVTDFFEVYGIKQRDGVQ